jgi:uroporphyrinogen-III synthase
VIGTATAGPAGLEPLAGYTVGITAARRREEFGAALARRGAKVMYGPAIRIVPLADDTQLREATERCLAAPLDVVVATTGIGFRGWTEAADAWNLLEGLTKTIGGAVVLARGPKAKGAIRASGLRETWSPESESFSEVLEYLITHHDLTGKRVAVQLHGEPLPDVVDTLRMAGADVIEVPVYRWIPPKDTEPLRRLVDAVAAASLDAVAFTSAPAAASFLDTAETLGLGEAIRAALRGPVIAACVGPITANPLLSEDVPVIQPTRARLGSLVREIVEQVPRRRGRLLPLADHRVDIRGQAVVVDDRLVPLSRTGMTLLRRLAHRPGHVVSRRDLLLAGQSGPSGAGGPAASAGASGASDFSGSSGSSGASGAAGSASSADEHAVEVAVGRLRTALGDPRIIQTVAKRGYRLAYEPERTALGEAGWRY